jgi:hypothetical protein
MINYVKKWLTHVWFVNIVIIQEKNELIIVYSNGLVCTGQILRYFAIYG